jgi:chemotaxis family two-component system response regulator Rcp1
VLPNSCSESHRRAASLTQRGDSANLWEVAGNNQHLDVLLVEDSPDDARLVQEGFRRWSVRNRLTIAEDGEQALKILRRQAPFERSSRPGLILLDLNLPKRDGREVLAEIKNDPTLRRIPVIVLTTSDAEQDVLRAYDLHANCYMTKPAQIEEFLSRVHAIEDFWLTVVRLPH